MMQGAVLFIVGGTLFDMKMLGNLVSCPTAVITVLPIKGFQDIPFLFTKLLPGRNQYATRSGLPFAASIRSSRASSHKSFPFPCSLQNIIKMLHII